MEQTNKTNSRKLTIEDLFDNCNIDDNKNYINNQQNMHIQKNQKDYGHKKRIKP